MKVLIFPNLKKKNAEICVIKACDILHNKSVDIYIDFQYKETFRDLEYLRYGDFSELVRVCDVIIVIGGDGTILKCSKLISSTGKPILGINSGRLGFMATLEGDELYYLNDFAEGKYSIVKRMMLEGVIKFKNGDEIRQSVLNDIVVSRTPSCKIADFEVSMDGNVISSLRADGLIFSTPTGATAYSLSAGGPIIEPDMECIEFTQICPFSLFARTMIFSSHKKLKVVFTTSKEADVYVIFDGNEEISFSQNDELYISRSDNYIYFVEINGSGFYNSVNRKLIQPIKGDIESR